MYFHPIGAQILVRPTQKSADQQVGGIYLPESMTKNDPAVQGVVEAVGQGQRLPNGVLIAPDVKPGDKILFQRYGATEIKVGDDQMYLVVEEAILGLLVEES